MSDYKELNEKLNIEIALSDKFTQTFNSILDQMDVFSSRISSNEDRISRSFEKSGNGLKNVFSIGLGTFIGNRIASWTKGFVSMSDNIMNTTARLNGLTGSMEKTKFLQDEIFRSSERARGSYQLSAQMVSKLGMQAKNAFRDTNEIVVFSELMNKIFKISGTDEMGISSTMYNLTQALSSGVLRGQDFNSVISNAPILLEKVAEYMNVPMSKLRDLAQEGKISSQVIKNALFKAGDEIEMKFKAIPKTFGDHIQSAKNTLIKSLDSAVLKFNAIINSPAVQNFGRAIAYGFRVIGSGIDRLLKVSERAINFLYVNWHRVRVPLLAIATIFTGVLVFSVLKFAAVAVASAIKAIVAFAATHPVLFLMTFALMGVIKTVYQMGGSFADVFGFICGIGNVAVQFVFNAFNKLFSSIGKLLKGDFRGFFVDFLGWLVNSALDVLGIIAKGIDWLFGSNLKGALEDLRSYTNEAIGYEDDFTVEDSFDEGFAFGKNIIENFSLSGLSDQMPKLEMPKAENLLGDISKNTKDTKNELKRTNDDLKYLRSVAFSKAVNRFSLDGLNISVNNNFGDIYEKADIDGWTAGVVKELESVVNSTMGGLVNV